MSKDLELISELDREKKTYWSQTQRMRRVWENCWKYYIGSTQDRAYPWLNNVFVPKTHQSVELLTSFLVAKDPTLRARPQMIDDISKVPLVQKLLTFQWRKQMKMREKVITWVKSSILFGTGIMKVYWKTDVRNVGGEDRIIYDDPECQNVNLLDFYIDPFAPSISEAHSVIQRIIANREDVENNENYNKNKHNLVNYSDKSSNEDSSNLDYYDTDQAGESISKVELFERWTKENVITYGNTTNGTKILRKMPNPYGFIPFVAIRLKKSPLPNRFYGIGIIEPGLKLQFSLNSLVNQLMDNIQLIMNKMFKVKRDANINPRQLVSKPGGKIEVDELDDIDELSVSDIKSSAFGLYTLFDSEFQQGTGIPNILKSVPGAEFATEAALMQRNASTLLSIFQGNIEGAIAELGQMILRLDIDNIQDSRSVAIFKEQPKGVNATGQEIEFEPYEIEEFNPEDIRGVFDIEVVADSTISQDIVTLRKQLMDIYALVAKDPESGINRPKLLKTIFKLTGVPEIDDLFEQPSPPAEPQGGAENISRVTPRGEQLREEARVKSALSASVPENKI